MSYTLGSEVGLRQAGSFWEKRFRLAESMNIRRGDRKAGALLAPLLALASLYGLFTMASPSRSARLMGAETDLPAFAPDAPFLATRYLDRQRISAQTLP